MKKNVITALLFVFASLLSTYEADAQKFKDLDKSPMDAAAFPDNWRESNKLIKIVYSRPQLKGRSLEKLAPNGEVWRTGANEAAELTLYVDMKLGDQKIAAGTYSFFTIPGDNEWTAIISTDLNVWGAYTYKAENDVARINVPVTEDGKSLEAFSISFTEADGGVDMHMGWDKVRVSVPFRK